MGMTLGELVSTVESASPKPDEWKVYLSDCRPPSESIAIRIDNRDAVYRLHVYPSSSHVTARGSTSFDFATRLLMLASPELERHCSRIEIEFYNWLIDGRISEKMIVTTAAEPRYYD